MEKSFIYTREITDSNYSPDLATQIYNCKQCAEVHNLKVVNTYAEISSKKLKNYPIFEQMKKDCKKHKVDSVILYSLSVLGRKFYTAEKFIKFLAKHRVKPIFVDIDASPDKQIIEYLIRDYIVRRYKK